MNEIEAVGEAALLMPGGTESSGPERPWLYSLLIAPSAVAANGVIQGGVLAYLMSRQGMSSGNQSHLIGLLALPTSLYFLWSPITDFLVRRRTWLLAGAAVVGGADGGGVPRDEPGVDDGGGADVSECLLQPTGGVELRRHDGRDAEGAAEAGGGQLLPGWVAGVWGARGVRC